MKSARVIAILGCAATAVPTGLVVNAHSMLVLVPCSA